MHPRISVYVAINVPADVPVTMPVAAPMVAIADDEPDQVPPAGLEPSVIVEPLQSSNVPELDAIGVGNGLMVTLAEVEHPVGAV